VHVKTMQTRRVLACINLMKLEMTRLNDSSSFLFILCLSAAERKCLPPLTARMSSTRDQRRTGRRKCSPVVGRPPKVQDCQN